jgi:hypothetical protein
MTTTDIIERFMCRCSNNADGMSICCTNMDEAMQEIDRLTTLINRYCDAQEFSFKRDLDITFDELQYRRTNAYKSLRNAVGR